MTAHGIIGRCSTCEEVHLLRDALVPTHGPHTGPACPGSQKPPLPLLSGPVTPGAWCPLCRQHAEDIHTACHNHLHAELRRIPGLYRRLAAALEPDRTPTAHVSGSKLPPLPVQLQPLNLRGRGGILAILGGWETDWRDRSGDLAELSRAGHEQQLADDAILDDVVRFLADRLWWAAMYHPAVWEFAGDVREIVRDCRLALGDLDDYLPIGTCPARTYNQHICGARLRAYPQATSIYCDSCGTEWPKHRWPELGEQLNPPHEKDAA